VAGHAEVHGFGGVRLWAARRGATGGVRAKVARARGHGLLDRLAEVISSHNQKGMAVTALSERRLSTRVLLYPVG
jgi:hypothetical protein